MLLKLFSGKPRAVNSAVFRNNEMKIESVSIHTDQNAQDKNQTDQQVNRSKRYSRGNES